MATYRLAAAPDPNGVAFRLLSKPLIGVERAVDVQAWSTVESADLALPIGRLIVWRDEEIASQVGEAIIVPHATIAGLSDREARQLRLPPPPAVQLHVQCEGTIDQPGFRLRHGWREPTGQPVLGAARTGCWLQIGSTRAYRLPEHMFGLVEAIDDFNRTEPSDDGARWRCWAKVQELLPEHRSAAIASDPYLTSFRILHGSSFSIDPETIGGEFDIDPVILAASRRTQSSEEPVGDDEATAARSLLTPGQHRHFVTKRFRQAEQCRPRYALADGLYLVLDSDVQAALDVVRQVQRADRATRRDFVRNPRTYLRNALGDRLDEAVLEDLFVETAGYSNRVRDVGLWAPRVLPWLSREAGRWFPDQPPGQASGLAVGERIVPIAQRDLNELRAEVMRARARGEENVQYRGERIPATEETERALAQLSARPSQAPEPPPAAEVVEEEAEPKRVDGPQVLLIEENLDEVGYRRQLPRRNDRGVEDELAGLRTALKPHQREGLRWLIEAWRAGAPGALIADDMGLGKTLQCLAFLEWLARVQKRAGEARPFLVVAPTSLLETWAAEHDRHLHAPGLGEPVKIWGRGLAALRVREGGAEIDLGRCVLDRGRLVQASWLLTTYETLRDYQHTLAAIPLAAVVFDEVQKIKNPAALATNAAKAVNADFVIGATGTPVENRLADLWSIVDRVHEGFLSDLKTFSARFESEATPPERLHELKGMISSPQADLPALMLRRMKDEHLPGLPEKTEEVRARPMPPPQAEAYTGAINVARRQGRGDVLRALQAIRAISLHPWPADQATAGHFVAASARWQITFDALDEIARQGEKALIFLETIELQPVLATLVQKRFGLDRQPMVINGQVAGGQRQRRVDAFQNGRPGFDVIILGPRAAGLGLTLTAANHVIHLSRWWNPAVEDQCTDRVYRIGQDKPVFVHIPQAIWPEGEASSFDRRLHELLQRKRALSRDLLAPAAASEHDARELYEATIGSLDS